MDVEGSFKPFDVAGLVVKASIRLVVRTVTRAITIKAKTLYFVMDIIVVVVDVVVKRW